MYHLYIIEPYNYDSLGRCANCWPHWLAMAISQPHGCFMLCYFTEPLLIHTDPEVCPSPEERKYTGILYDVKQLEGFDVELSCQLLTRTCCFYISFGMNHTVMKVSEGFKRYQTIIMHHQHHHVTSPSSLARVCSLRVRPNLRDLPYY